MALVLEGPSALGEMALVQEGFKSTATVRSRAVCHALACKVDKAEWLLRQHPEDRDCMQALAEANLEDLRTILLRRFDLQRVLFRGNEEGIDIGSRKSEEVAEEDEPQDEEERDPDLVERRRTTMARYLMKTCLYGGDEQFVRFLAQYMEPQVYFDGQVLLQEGDEGDFAILLHDGSAVVEVGGVRVGEVHSGTVVGEMAMMGRSERRTATVRASGVATASRLPRGMVLLAFERFPQERERMEKTLEVRAKTNQMLTRSDHAPTPEKKAVLATKHSARQTTTRGLSEIEEDPAQAPQHQARLWSKVKSFKHAAALTRHTSGLVQTRERKPISAALERDCPGGAAGEPADLEADSSASADSAASEEAQGDEDPPSADGAAAALGPPRQLLDAVDEDAASGTTHVEVEAVSPKTAPWSPRRRRGRRPNPGGVALPALDAPGGASAVADAAAAGPRQPARQPSKQPAGAAVGSSFLPLVPAPPPEAAKSEHCWQLGGPKRLRKAEGLYGVPVWHEVFGRTLR
mmetsp:Transcript_62263/g.166482  ORF Transcript_62263/g.166482 Transcript_62263/m.166482 type:complete len:519 (-) Transcript_62263:158-1714(-)